MSSESLTVILAVGLIAGWLAGQIVRGTGYGIINDLASWVPLSAGGCCLNSASTSALASSLQSSTPLSARCCSFWF